MHGHGMHGHGHGMHGQNPDVYGTPPQPQEPLQHGGCLAYIYYHAMRRSLYFFSALKLLELDSEYGLQQLFRLFVECLFEFHQILVSYLIEQKIERVSFCLSPDMAFKGRLIHNIAAILITSIIMNVVCVACLTL